MTTEFVAANGLVFEVEQCGEGDRLALCLHGFPELAASWRDQLPMLADLGFRAWAPNLRGYGGSSRPPCLSDYRIENLMNDVAGLIDASRARSVVLIGHDWGGLIAWLFATRRIRPLDALITLNIPHPACFMSALSRWRQLRKSWYFLAFQIPWLPDWLLGRKGGRAIRESLLATSRFPERFPRDLLDLYSRNAASPGGATAMLNWYRAAVRGGLRRQLKAGFPVIDVPTLMIWGDRDAFIENAAFTGAEAYVSDLTLTRLPGISHWVQHEDPAAVNGAIAGFLQARALADASAPAKA